MLAECPSQHIEDLGERAVDFRVPRHRQYIQRKIVLRSTPKFEKKTLFYVSSFVEDILDMISSVIASFCAIRPNLSKSRANRANHVNFLTTIIFSDDDFFLRGLAPLVLSILM